MSKWHHMSERGLRSPCRGMICPFGILKPKGGGGPREPFIFLLGLAVGTSGWEGRFLRSDGRTV